MLSPNWQCPQCDLFYSLWPRVHYHPHLTVVVKMSVYHVYSSSSRWISREVTPFSLTFSSAFLSKYCQRCKEIKGVTCKLPKFAHDCLQSCFRGQWPNNAIFFIFCYHQFSSISILLPLHRCHQIVDTFRSHTRKVCCTTCQC